MMKTLMTKRNDKFELNTGVIFWQPDDEFSSLLADTLQDFGCQTISFLPDAKLPDGLDVVFALGPFGSLVPIANQLLDCLPSKRPQLVLWMTEQFPDPSLPEWFRYGGGIFRSYIEQLAFRRQDQGDWQIIPQLEWLTTKAHRFRYYGDLFWLQHKNILSVLAIGSQWTAAFLRRRGFDPVTAYYGFRPDMGKDLNLERDIPVLWLGKMGTDRRKDVLQHIRASLRDRGVEILVVDGVENPYVFGEERTVLLNRTKITLNLLRQKWDNHSLRYYLASSNRVMVVSEPTFQHIPFVTGEHVVEIPFEQMADTICYFLSHDEERQQIANQAHQLVTTELTFEHALFQILERVALAQMNDSSNEKKR